MPPAGAVAVMRQAWLRRVPLALPMAAALLVVMAIPALVGQLLQARGLDYVALGDAERRNQGVTRLVAETLERETAQLQSRASALAGSRGFAREFARMKSQPAAAREAWHAGLRHSHGLEMLHAIDARGALLFGAADAPATGDADPRRAGARAMRGGTMLVAEPSAAALVLRAWAPVAKDGEVEGAISVAIRWDDALAHTLAQASGATVALATAEGIWGASRPADRQRISRERVAHALMSTVAAYTHDSDSATVTAYNPLYIAGQKVVLITELPHRPGAVPGIAPGDLATFFATLALTLLAAAAIGIIYRHARSGTRHRAEEVAAAANEPLPAEDSELDFRRFADSMADQVFITNPENSRVYYVNPATEHIWGLTPQQVYERPERIMSMIHADDLELFEVRRRMEQELEPVYIEFRIAHASRGQRWLSLQTQAIRVGNGEIRVHGVCKDVTQHRLQQEALTQAKEQAEAASMAKSQFLANMSHEIRTPMNGVLGVLHLLKSENLSADGRQLLEEAVGCGQMLAELLNDVIDFSKIEAGRLELSPEAIDPAALMDSVAGLLRPQAVGRGLWLNTHVQPDLGWASIDPVRLRQTLFNLIGNAVKFTLTGGVDARLSRVNRDGESRLRYEIVDTGVGISPESQTDLFQRFHQADGSTTRRFGGSGLGLAISRRLADLMGGEIGFSSELGKGSTFWIEVVAPRVEADTPATSETQGLLEGLRVLVVEDNPTNRLIATRMLEQLGAAVETAEDGQQGVEAASRSAFDLIFMDIQMPVMDGVEATRRIRALPEPACSTPILAMTANAMSHQADSYLIAGMNGIVPKPLSPAALISQIAAIVAQSAHEAAA